MPERSPDQCAGGFAINRLASAGYQFVGENLAGPPEFSLHPLIE
eukprot:SAG31_NODE_5058_length_2768_cov_1.632072_2_plen_44_part_00